MRKIIVFLFGLILFSQVALSVNLTDDLVSYYKFDETSGTTSYDELSVNNGTISGATINQTGKIGTAYTFDGSNDYISSNNIPLTTFSIGGWIKFNSYTNQDWVGFIGKRDSLSGASYWTLEQKFTTTNWQIMFSGNSNTRTIFYTLTNHSINQWYHLFYTYDGTNLTIYLDGVKVNSSIYTFTDVTANINIGAWANALNYYLNGAIDEPAIWNRSLSADEISALYADGDGFSYPFEEEEPESPDLTAVQYLYEIDYTGDKIYQYNCTTAWNLSSCTYVANKDTQATFPFGLSYSNDGTKLYEGDRISNKIYQSNCSTAWSLSTCSYTGINISTQDADISGLDWKYDGTKLYEVGYGSDKIYEYSCSTAWSLSTCTYSGINISTQDTSPTGLSFGNKGTKLYEIGQYGDSVNGSIYQYSCSTAWSLSTCSYDSISIRSQNWNPSGMYLTPLLANTAPSIVYDTAPVNDTYSNEANISIAFTPTDSEGDTMDCFLVVNGETVNQSLAIVSGTATTITYTLPISATYTWTIACTDGQQYTTETERTYIFDSIPPEITWSYPATNRTLVSALFNLNISVSDDYLYRINMSVYYPNGTEFYNNYSGDVEVSQYNITDTINMTGQPRGWYTIKVSATDDHTYGELKDISLTQPSDRNIQFVTGTQILNVEFNMRDSKGYKSTPVTTTIEEVYIYDKIQKDGKLFRPATNYLTEYKWNYEFIAQSSTDEIIITLYSPNGFNKRTLSGLAAHYIYGDYYVDFEAAKIIYVNGKPTQAEVKVIAETKTEIQIKIDAKFNAGDHILIDPVTGGLNTQTEYMAFYYDTAPVSVSAAITPTEIAPGNTILGWCNVTDMDADTLSYSYIWYRNDVEYSTGNYISYSTATIQDTPDAGTGYAEGVYAEGTYDYLVDVTYYKPASLVWALWNITLNDDTTELIDLSDCLDESINLSLAYTNWDIICNGITIQDNDACIGFDCWTKTIKSDEIIWYSGGLAQNVSHNIANVTIPMDSLGDTWIFACLGFDGIYFSDFVNSTGIEVNYTFAFIFRDEKTQDIINTSTIYVEFISDDDVYNYTTSTGLLSIGDISPDNYTVRYYSDDHGRKRHYYYSYSGIFANNITLYLLDENQSQSITMTVYNEQTLTVIPGAVIYLQRYYQSENVYKTVAMYESDVAGKAYFDVEFQTEQYKVLVDYPWLTNRLNSQPFYVEESNINLYISLESDFGQTFFDKTKITASLSYNEGTRTFSATYTDSEAVASNFCLYLKTYGTYSKETINTTCSTANSATLTVSGLTENQTYNAVLSTTISGSEQILLTGWKELGLTDMGTKEYGVFLTIIIFVVLVFVSSFHLYTMIFVFIGLIFAKLIGLLAMDWTWILGLWLSSALIVLFMKMRK